MLCSATGSETPRASSDWAEKACTEIGTSLTAFGNTMTSLSSTLASDPKGASAKVTAAAAKFQTAADGVTNPTIKAAAEKASKSITTFSADLAATATSHSTANVTKLEDSLTGLETNMTAIETACK